MMPFSEIMEGDQYQNPLLRPDGCVYIVIEKNAKEKMIKIQAVTSYVSPKYSKIGKPIWKKNTDRMFSETWRIFSMPRGGER